MIPKKHTTAADFFTDFSRWPGEWMENEKDLVIGNSLLDLFGSYVESLIKEGKSERTIKNHMNNMAMLGSEIIRCLNDEDINFRRLKPKKLLLKYINDEEGPLIQYFNPNNQADEVRLKSFDNTCKKLCRFIICHK